jgi:hypothetical protein
MRSKLAPGERPVIWVASAKKDLLAMPKPVIREIGIALDVPQQGGMHPSAKPWKGEGPDRERFRWKHVSRRLHVEVPKSDLRSALLSEEIAERDQDGQGGCGFDYAATEGRSH